MICDMTVTDAAAPAPTAGAARRARLSGLHARVLDALGVAICRGELPAGSILYIDALVEHHQVSRSVVREALRVLTSMGLVESRRRVGTIILPASEWNAYDPQVIRWRLASEARTGQLRSITELRTAVEPEAALLAAERCTHEEGSTLVALAARMWAAGKAGRQEAFLELDIEFHRRVLAGSQNEMFRQLHELVAEVLSGRTHYGLMPVRPDEVALQLHVDVAQAILRRDGEAARTAMRHIMAQAMDEMSTVWPADGDAVADLAPGVGVT